MHKRNGTYRGMHRTGRVGNTSSAQPAVRLGSGNVGDRLKMPALTARSDSVEVEVSPRDVHAQRYALRE